MKLVPLNDRVVLKQCEAEETTKSGIILTSASQEKPQEAEVVAVGPGGVVDGKEVKSSFQQLTLKELEIVYITFHYNAKGHSSRALTISFINSKDKIVMQLGSGSLDLR